MEHDLVIISSRGKIGIRPRIFNNQGKLNSVPLKDVLVAIIKYAALFETDKNSEPAA
jgi:hypothetical protein